MKKILVLLYLLHLLWFCGSVYAIEFSSGSARVNLVELYTSEGCSSCPPADHWMNQLKDDPGLWSRFVPLAFHVDYWDYLGWKDEFADPEFAKRQRLYATHRYVSSVYTPAVMLNGRGWRGWRFFNDHKNSVNNKPGILNVSLTDTEITVEFISALKHPSPLILNIALLGRNLKSRITSGENKGEFFTHDFVVLDHQIKKTDINSDSNVTRWHIDKISYDKKKKFNKTNVASAIAFWINRKDDPTPIQATGGWID